MHVYTSMNDQSLIYNDDTLPSPDAQRRYIKRNIDTVPIKVRRRLAQVLIDAGRRDNLYECAEGLVVNFDTMPKSIVGVMYGILVVEKYIAEALPPDYSID